MKKILAADDDQGLLALYQAIFSGAGYEVLLAPDGDKAMELFLSEAPDLLVLDVDMPGGGGGRVFSITRRILATGVPVIFVTGHSERVLDSALLHDKVVILPKPLDERELLAQTRRLLGGS